MKKRILSLILVGALSISIVGCSKSNKSVDSTEKIKVVMITDEGGINDQSFNQSAWTGFENSKEKFENIEISYLESKQESDYTQNIETAVDGGADLVVGVGFKLADAMLEASKSYPEVNFTMIDATYDEIPDNMVTTTFSEEQAGYLTGLVVGKMASEGVTKFGFVGGMDIPTVTQFAVGYERALKEINPNFELVIQIANSFTDSAKGKAIANQMFNDGIETIFAAGGGVNIGIFESAKEKGKYAVGVDMACNHISPEEIITSALKNVNVGVENSIEQVVEGTFEGGKNIKYDLSNGGVGYEKTKLIPNDVIEFVDSKLK